jgi:uncharacterized protein (DUF305 family)
MNETGSRMSHSSAKQAKPLRTLRALACDGDAVLRLHVPSLGIAAFSLLALAVFFVLIRQQSAIADVQFLRSMIPHHAGAILMCQRSPVEDAEIERLCQTIIAGQQSEIDQMKRILTRLENRR